MKRRFLCLVVLSVALATETRAMPGVVQVEQTDIPGVVRLVSSKQVMVLAMYWTKDDGRKWSDVIDGTMSGVSIPGPPIANGGQEVYLAPAQRWYERSKIVPPSDIYHGELDLVIFSDGERFGPDRNRTFDLLLARAKEMTEVADGILQGRLGLAELERLSSTGAAPGQEGFWRQQAALSFVRSLRYAPAPMTSRAEGLKHRMEETLKLLVPTNKNEEVR